MTQKHQFSPELRKRTRDNLGLIISVLAALFAGWTGVETHRAVNAQVAAVLLESNLGSGTLRR